MEWIVANIGTIAVSAVLAGVLIAVIILLVKRKKQGKTSCSCGCSGCANAQYCHSAKESEKTSDKP